MRSINPALIGAFVLGGLAVAVGLLGYLGSGEFIREREPFISYFDESVDGLELGAPVKFRGITLGEVERLALYRSPSNEHQYAAVVFELDLESMRELGVDVDFSNKQIVRDAIERGLRARLELESIVTGVVFIELEFSNAPGPAVFVNPDGEYVEIPTTRSALAELGQSATEVVARLSAVDAPAIGNKIVEVLDTFNNTMLELDADSISAELLITLRDVQQTLEETQLASTTADLRLTLDEYRQSAEIMNAHLESLLFSLDSATTDLADALQSLRTASDNVDRTLSPDSDVMVALQQMLEESEETMRAVRRFAELLERNPRVLLTGKSGPE